MSDVFTLLRGTTPLMVSAPHAGTAIPERFTKPTFRARSRGGHRLASGSPLCVRARPRCEPDRAEVLALRDRSQSAAGTIADVRWSEQHRAVADALLSGDPMYREGRAPDAAEIARRRDRYWKPYHDALAAELVRLKAAVRPCDPVRCAFASSPSCPGCSKDGCPTSTSVRRAARVARRRCVRACGVLDGAARVRRSSMAASRVVTSRAITADRTQGHRGPARDVPGLLHGRGGAVRLRATMHPRVRRCCAPGRHDDRLDAARWRT